MMKKLHFAFRDFFKMHPATSGTSLDGVSMLISCMAADFDLAHQLKKNQQQSLKKINQIYQKQLLVPQNKQIKITQNLLKQELELNVQLRPQDLVILRVNVIIL